MKHDGRGLAVPCGTYAAKAAAAYLRGDLPEALTYYRQALMRANEGMGPYYRGVSVLYTQKIAEIEKEIGK